MNPHRALAALALITTGCLASDITTGSDKDRDVSLSFRSVLTLRIYFHATLRHSSSLHSEVFHEPASDCVVIGCIHRCGFVGHPPKSDEPKSDQPKYGVGQRSDSGPFDSRASLGRSGQALVSRFVRDRAAGG